MFNFKSKKEFKSIYGSTKKLYSFDKIMLLSCSRVTLNRYKLVYLINHTFSSDESVSIFIHSLYLDLNQFNQVVKYKFGVWLSYKVLPKQPNQYYYVYIDNSKKLIYKSTKNDNFLSIGDHNSYGHKLIYKALISDNLIIESKLR